MFISELWLSSLWLVPTWIYFLKFIFLVSAVWHHSKRHKNIHVNFLPLYSCHNITQSTDPKRGTSGSHDAWFSWCPICFSKAKNLSWLCSISLEQEVLQKSQGDICFVPTENTESETAVSITRGWWAWNLLTFRWNFPCFVIGSLRYVMAPTTSSQYLK